VIQFGKFCQSFKRCHYTVEIRHRQTSETSRDIWEGYASCLRSRVGTQGATVSISTTSC
jgi:hypothetical protein